MKNFYRNFLKLCSMLVLQNVVTLSVNFADNIMFGAFSETALSGCDHRKPGTVRLSAAAYGSGRRTCHIRKSVLGKERDRAGKEDRCLGHAHRLFYCPCAVYPGQSFSQHSCWGFLQQTRRLLKPVFPIWRSSGLLTFSLQ